MSEVSPDNLLLVGKVIRPHGLRGLLRVWSYSQSDETFLNKETIFLKADPEVFNPIRVISVTPHKNIYLMELDGLNSLEEAERFRGAEVFVNKDDLVRNDKNEYFWYELIGLQVFLDTDLYLGTLTEIMVTGSNDIYVVRKGKNELLVPAIHDVVKEIDLENKKMIITEMQGLFSINEV